MAFYSIGIAGFTLLEVLSRAFYALEDTWTPVIVGIGAMVSNIILNLIFVQFIGEPGNLARGPFAGLALANASTTVVESLVLWWLMRRRIGHLGDVAGINDRAIIKSASGTIAASSVMGMGLFVVTQLISSDGLIVAIIGGIVGAVIFFGIGLVFNLGETRDLLNPIVRRGLRLMRR